jgi:hypothetical protein
MANRLFGVEYEIHVVLTWNYVTVPGVIVAESNAGRRSVSRLYRGFSYRTNRFSIDREALLTMLVGTLMR